MRPLSETGITKALGDPHGGLRFHQRFQYRLLAYLLALAGVSSVVAGGIYYRSQKRFVAAEQQQRGKTLISNLAGQSELGAYSGDRTFLFGPARRAMSEADVDYVAIYDARGEALIEMRKPGVDASLYLPQTLLRELTRAPGARHVLRRRAQHDDMFAPIVSVREDAEQGLYATPEDRQMTIGVARLGLSRQPAQAQLDQALHSGIYLGLIVLLLGTVTGLVLARRVSRPIMALARSADEVRRGNLGHQIDVARQDELGLLAVSFNRMSTKLRDTVDSLAHLNRNLEREVVRRTAEIQRSRDFAVLMNAPLQLDSLLDTALNALVANTEALAGAVYLQSPAGTAPTGEGQLELVVSQGSLAGAFQLPQDETPPWVLGCAETGEAAVVRELDPQLGLVQEHEGLATLVCVPVQHRTRLEAVIVLGLAVDPEPDAIKFVEHCASELATAVSNARALEAAERLARELERRNVALLQQRDQLQELNRLKSEFLANVSHELRTPLNAVVGYTELLTEGIYGEMNEPQLESLTGITENAKNLLELINQILDLSRVEAGRMKVSLRSLDVKQAVLEVLDLSAPLVRDRPYTVVAELPEHPLYVRADPAMVRQILLNLVSNAVKFTAEGSVVVVASMEGDDELNVQVRDTGIGIRPEHVGVIFDEFRQVDGSSTRTHGGTGLGLAISKKFATLLGGDIVVESIHGEGSTFTLVLPHPSTTTPPEAEMPDLSVTIGETHAS